MKISDIAWTAGILDGEGSIMVSVVRTRSSGIHCWRAVVSVSNTKIEMLNKLKTLWGGRITNVSERSNNRQAGFTWRVEQHKATAILSKSLSYLVIKQKQAKNALQFLKHMRLTNKVCAGGRHGGHMVIDDYRVGRRGMFAHKSKLLNRRG